MKISRVYYFISAYIFLVTAYSLYAQTGGFKLMEVDWLLNWKAWAMLTPIFTGLISTLIFVGSRFKMIRPLQIYCCYIIFNIPFFILTLSSRFTFMQENDGRFLNTLLIGIVLTLALYICSFVFLWLSTQFNKPFLKLHEIGGETFSEFEPVVASTRFVNRLIDALIIVLVLLMNIFENYYFKENFRGTGTFTLYMVEIAAALLYYLLLEGFFKITIGKCITNTIVVNESGERPSFMTIAGRTLCRFIPFDAFSFLGANSRGWHDSMSGTYVVKKSLV